MYRFYRTYVFRKHTMVARAKNVNSHLVILDENPRSDHRKPLKKGVYNPWSDDSSKFDSNPWTDVAHLGEPTAEVLKNLVPPPMDKDHGPCRIIMAANLEDDLLEDDVQDVQGSVTDGIRIEDELRKIGYDDKQITVLSIDEYAEE